MARNAGLDTKTDLKNLVVWFSIREYPAHQGGGLKLEALI